MDADAAAAYLGVHPETVRLWARKGRIPRVKVGRWWRFRKADLEDWTARGGNITEGQQTKLEV